MVQSIPEVFSSFNHLPVYAVEVDLQLLDVYRICRTLAFRLGSCHDVVYTPFCGVYFHLEDSGQFLFKTS